MALTKISDLRELTDQSITEKILDIKKQLFDLRFLQATRQEVKPHQYKHLRHTLSQLMTLERERQLQGAMTNANSESGDV